MWVLGGEGVAVDYGGGEVCDREDESGGYRDSCGDRREETKNGEVQ